jgi:hypothetical protein
MPFRILRSACLLALLFFPRPAFALNVTLRWTAPGNDGTVGTAYRYEMRRSTRPITSANFASADTVSGMPAPMPAGTVQSVVVPLPSADSLYYFAMRTRDLAGNWSPISNSPPASGLLAVDNPQPGAGFSIPFPNPARATVRVHLSLAIAQEAAVDVFDTLGRRVRVLARGILPAGERELAWDLRDDAGHRVAPGVYMLAARLDGRVSVRRVSVVA